MNLLEPIYFDPGSYSYDRLCVTPYTNLHWEVISMRYGISIPKVIDMTHGKSVCMQCKAVYAGYQPKCSKKVVFHKKSGAYYDSYGYNFRENNFEKICDGYLEWDLEDEFNYQKEFFSLLDKINNLPDPSYDPLVKFQKHFPEGVTDHLKVRLLAAETENKIIAITNAINTLAGKMNQAGTCLSF